MSLPTPRCSRPRHDQPAGLPPPGPFPAAWPPREAAVIFVVILIVMAWMLAHGCPVTIAMETVAWAGMFAVGVASRLADRQPADE